MKHNFLRGGMKFYATFILILLSLLTSPCLLYAQNDASITGSVLDPSGNVVSNAVVTITGEANGQHRKATADAQGHFAVNGLSDGKYTVEATASGFATTIQNNLVLAPGQTRNITLALSVGKLSQSVTVEASASNLLGALVNIMPVMRAMRSATILSKPTGAVSRLQHLAVTLEDMVCRSAITPG